ncbi:DEAD/DEAH box helicase family protein [Anaerolineales bacterium HSG6]|nr:DEAD/DEAH box helicase family protein [Anaerolineales bacterium HSG6]MDM8531546.1 DEAD/DEAH box helicase family protein [Anaerolineales bacterium HSG25]
MTINLRTWQHEAMQNYQQALKASRRSILWEATPGAGKTTAALQLCLHQMNELGRERLIIVVPTTHLKSQWAQAARQFQIDIDSKFRNRRDWALDYHGVTVTYQQIANHPKLYQRLSEGAVVVLDEIHHAGDGLSWGDGLREAFKDAEFVLALSGTAFRSDNSTIPFVKYEDDISQPDYVYAYGRAIEDGVCRSVAFFTYGGEMAWLEDDNIIEAKFTDRLTSSSESRRLRAALDPTSGWMHTMLEDAHKMLVETRREHPDAGGLLVAADQEHAHQLAALLQEVSRTRPTVVVSDDRAASNKIKKFADSQRPWLVAVNMVSEGVDIPRLRVGVYATTITTRLYFRQFLGRIVRMTPQPDGVQVAYCYLPADLRLKMLAEHIEREQRHFVATQVEREEDDDVEPLARQPIPEWKALRSTNHGIESVIVHGGQLSLWGGADQVGQPAVVKQQLKQKVAERVVQATKSEKKAALTKQIKHLVAAYHHKSGKPYPQIHAYLNKKQGVQSQAYCTERQLERRAEILGMLLQKN